MNKLSVISVLRFIYTDCSGLNLRIISDLSSVIEEGILYGLVLCTFEHFRVFSHFVLCLHFIKCPLSHKNQSKQVLIDTRHKYWCNFKSIMTFTMVHGTHHLHTHWKHCGKVKFLSLTWHVQCVMLFYNGIAAFCRVSHTWLHIKDWIGFECIDLHLISAKEMSFRKEISSL